MKRPSHPERPAKSTGSPTYKKHELIRSPAILKRNKGESGTEKSHTTAGKQQQIKDNVKMADSSRKNNQTQQYHLPKEAGKQKKQKPSKNAQCLRFKITTNDRQSLLYLNQNISIFVFNKTDSLSRNHMDSKKVTLIAVMTER